MHSAHLANQWYSGDAAQLRSDIESYFQMAHEHFTVSGLGENISAVVVPHAGYVYSGLGAAAAYRPLLGVHKDFVVVLAPSHTEAVAGSVVLPDFEAYETPLGKIRLATDEMDALIASSPVFAASIAHSHIFKKEHSIEIQLPMLQYALGTDFALLPVISNSQKCRSHWCK